MLRLFVAIRFSEVVRERLRLVQGGIEGVAWTRPENLHLTLRFIGDVEEPEVAEIDKALAGIDEAGFSLGLSGVGLFGTPDRPRVLWAGVAASAALSHLQAKVERAVTLVGLEPERQRFTPHVTLGRPDPPSCRADCAVAGVGRRFQRARYSGQRFCPDAQPARQGRAGISDVGRLQAPRAG
jgi:2'-5' RNA ligase